MKLSTFMVFGLILGFALGAFAANKTPSRVTGGAANALCGMRPVPPMGFKKTDAVCMCLENPPRRATCKWVWTTK